MEEFVTYTTETNEIPVALTRTEYKVKGNLPEDWVEFIWQYAVSKEEAVANHNERLDEYMD